MYMKGENGNSMTESRDLETKRRQEGRDLRDEVAPCMWGRGGGCETRTVRMF
jgi:hypothetical protein